ncbi:coiled-coil domain-containing protein 68 isoform X2 [Cygnus olor]|uniref:coiled-coil domain-containing protein 68 isoform X2 n=1 Tax=Cygnus olor TaxID=8869 RepID=UPI001ADEB376|nr:coiled-coil domain-containing protein 68 isoform X2 [Cygnus olor]
MERGRKVVQVPARLWDERRGCLPGSWLLGEQRNARIVTTTLLLTEEVMREDRGSEGSYVLYGSSCAEITEEAEYVRKHPPVLGRSPEPSGWGSSCSPVAAKMRETERQLLLVSRENEVLRIKLEATREAGVQALRAASQKLYENYQTRSEELRKAHENEKKQVQARSREQEEKLQQKEEDARRLASDVEERCARIAGMEQRVRRMEEEKKTLIEKKTSYEKMLLQMMSRNEDSKRCLAVQQDIATLREQIGHLQRLIGAQHQSLRRVIQEVEELNEELKIQDKKIEDLTEKVTALETQNEELKDRVALWSGQPKMKVSKAVLTDPLRDYRASPYLLLTRMKQQDS